MLPTFLSTEANSKHLFFFKVSDVRRGEVHVCTARDHNVEQSCPGQGVLWHPAPIPPPPLWLVHGVCGTGCAGAGWAGTPALGVEAGWMCPQQSSPAAAV